MYQIQHSYHGFFLEFPSRGDNEDYLQITNRELNDEIYCYCRFR